MPHLRKLALDELPSVQEAQRERRYLYVIQENAECYYKVGIASHPHRRLSALQGGNRRKLTVVAAYAGSASDCAHIEKVALKYLKAPAGSEWVHADYLYEITDFLDAFCQEVE